MRRVLRGDDKKRIRQAARLAFDGDLMFFHRLKQRALRLGRGAVDFVGQHHLRKYRAGVKFKLGTVAVVDRHAQHIGGQQVTGELDTMKVQAERRCQRMRQRGFANPRHVFNQQMAACDQTRERELYLPLFAENDAADLLTDFFYFYHK